MTAAGDDWLLVKDMMMEEEGYVGMAKIQNIDDIFWGSAFFD